jgi:hypothetical protein
MNLAETFKALLVAQIAAFVLAIGILYSASSGDMHGLAALFAILPMAAFYILATVNFVLLNVYFVRVLVKMSTFDRLVPILIAVNIFLVFMYRPITNWVP